MIPPRPMKPASQNLTPDDLQSLQYPLIATTKIDGIGCRLYDGHAWTPQNKPIPNLLVQAWAEQMSHLQGLQGELFAGNFNNTTSIVMSQTKSVKGLEFHVYDNFEDRRAYAARLNNARVTLQGKGNQKSVIPMTLVAYHTCCDATAVANEYKRIIKTKGEGLVLRDPTGEYKFGRTTLNEGLALKMKPFADAEATIRGILPLQTNTNPKVENALGLSSRGKSQANLQPLQMLGAFIVEDGQGRVFKIGGGDMTKAQREAWWRIRASLIGKTLTYAYLNHGGKNLPRSPKFKGFRLDI